MSLDKVKNFARVTVSTGYSSSDISIVLTTGDGLKLPTTSDGNYNLVWWNSSDYADPSNDPNVEVIRVTNLTSDTLTITRAQESTLATNKNTSGKTYSMALTVTEKMITDINAKLQKTIQFTIGDGINIIQTGTTIFTPPIPFACTIKYWQLTEVSQIPVTTTTVIDIKKGEQATYPTTNSITNVTPPTLTAEKIAYNSTLSGWTTSISLFDFLSLYVSSNTYAKKLILTIGVEL